ncbi:NERD domain-containing protein [Macrococcus epidermidis]|uniref:nuclease-related domain-containing protein n=1 Tax=Macrococcus epidermidis TaxID=1902580 RepID=UPI001EF20674|nr:nuclease-related domain-containing protein [Macrococcus epidermidis]MCG7419036.1 NERD domain-containing protein [Macrococcus epidermidis]
MIQPPRIVVLEDILKRRLPSYEYSEDYHRSYYGYLGELQFLNEFPVEDKYIQLFNICIEFEGQSFEVDRMILTGEKIFAFDVKNYFGKFVNEGMVWKKPGFSIKNPEAQFMTMHETLTGLIQWMETGHSVESKMIFINKGFSFQNKVIDMVKYYDIGQVMKSVGECAAAGELESRMASYFNDIHRPISLYDRRPNFNFEKVKRGLQCTKCGLEINIICDKTKAIVCKGCLKRMKKMELIRDNLIELEVLLNRPITTKDAHRWVGRELRNTTYRVLEKYFKKDGEKYFYFTNYYK